VAGVCIPNQQENHVETTARALYGPLTMDMRSWRSPQASLGREVGHARDGTAKRYCWFAIKVEMSQQVTSMGDHWRE
jgi:hypothetical protein